MQYAVESYLEIIDEVKETVAEHYEETELYSKEIPLDPNYEMYQLLNAQGVAQYFTARLDGALKGYLLVFIEHKPHCQTALYSVADMIYVAPGFRRSGVAENLMEVWEAEMRKQGVSVLAISFKHEMNPRDMMDHLEYDSVETLYTKYIKE